MKQSSNSSNRFNFIGMRFYTTSASGKRTEIAGLVCFSKMSRAAVVLHRQLSLEDLQQLLAWYKVRDTLLGQNHVEQDIRKAVALACICNHPNAVWLTKLVGGRDVASRKQAMQVLLGCENDPRAPCFAALLGGTFEELVKLPILAMRLHKR
jgi:hypothetical protein